MLIKSYNCYNDQAEGKINPMNIIGQTFRTTDIVITKLREIKPEFLENYVTALTRKLNTLVKTKKSNSNLFDLKDFTSELNVLSNYPELLKAILNFITHTLMIPKGYKPEQGEINLLYSNIFKAREIFSYHRVKTFVELLGNKKGSIIYKKIVPDLIIDMNKQKIQNIDKTKDPTAFTVTEQRDNAIETRCRIGLVDFTAVTFDDYMVLYRFDKCGVHEALKEFADPDIAYLCSCYLGDAEGFNDGKIIHMRRTQTLHHGKFCDEFYWNDMVHKNPDQPSLQFTESLEEKVINS